MAVKTNNSFSANTSFSTVFTMDHVGFSAYHINSTSNFIVKYITDQSSFAHTLYILTKKIAQAARKIIQISAVYIIGVKTALFRKITPRILLN